MIDFNKVVKKLGNKKGTIIKKDYIFEIIDPEKKENFENKLTKYIYRLKALKVIIPLKGGIYLIPKDEDLELNEIDLIEKYYFKFVKKIITENVGSFYFIYGKKSLEFHNKNFSPSEKLIVITKDLEKKVKFGDYEIIFRQLKGSSENNLFGKLKEFSNYVEIDGTNLKHSNLEMAILESLLISDDEGIDKNLISKTLKKYYKVLKKENLKEIGKYKYIMSINRLKELSKNKYPEIYEVCLEIVKENGGLFIGSNLRGDFEI